MNWKQIGERAIQIVLILVTLAFGAVAISPQLGAWLISLLNSIPRPASGPPFG